jgi:alpha-glucosidase (family GH31 glycosyl hydrolase)
VPYLRLPLATLAALALTAVPAHAAGPLKVVGAQAEKGGAWKSARASVHGGVITVKGGGTATRVTFAAAKGEQFYGLGERADATAHRGSTVENYVADGPFSPDSYAIVRNTIPPAGFRASRDSTYYPVPWVLSSRGYGVLLDNNETSSFDLAHTSSKRWTIEVDAPTLKATIFDGHGNAAAALAKFTKATGRQPAPAAPWAFGPWFQTGQPNTVPLADEASWMRILRDNDAPVSAAETQLRYLPCGLDRGNEDYENQRVAQIHAEGLADLTYINPMVCQSYDAVFSQGGLQTRADGSPATFNSFVGGTGPAGFTIQQVAQLAFPSAAASRTWKSVTDRIVGTGHDGWMEDFGEYTPADAVNTSHNAYPTAYHCAANAIAKSYNRPIVRFQRSGWTGAAKCAQIVWGGDPTTTFGFDGLSSAVKNALGMGLSGVSRWGSDIGGYDSIGNDPRLTPDLLKRWIEFGAVSAVMRTKSSGLAIPAYTRPQIWDPAILPTWRKFAKLHTQLYPYINAADAQYRRTGVPLMRHLLLAAPGQRWTTSAADTEFGFGDDILAAPVVSTGTAKRSVYLPKGEWIDGAKALSYTSGDGSYNVTRGAATTLKGGRTVRAAAAIDTLPLFVRAGSVLPLLPADTDSLSPYSAQGVTSLATNAKHYRLLAFPAAATRVARLSANAGDTVTSRLKGGVWTLKIHGTTSRSYNIQAPLAKACSVKVGGKPLDKAVWSVKDGVLNIGLGTTRTITLVVATRC